MEKHTYTERQLLDIWETIGKQNSWIAEAHDPPFDKTMLDKCHTPEELQSKLAHGNWSVGQGFYYQNLCFINQVDGGDEWLTIKDNYGFESITFMKIIKRGEFMKLLNRLRTATKEQCIKLKY